MGDELIKREDPMLDLFGEDVDGDSLIELQARIRPDQWFGLELMERARMQRGQAPFDRQGLVQEALDLLIEKNIIAIRLPREH
jgi:hypothetical protein